LGVVSGGGGGGGGTVVNQSAVGNNGANFTTTSASFVDLTGATVSIAAVAADVLYCTFISTFTQSTNAVNTFFTTSTTTGAHTIDSQQYTAVTLSQQYPSPLSGLYTVVSGDISAGTVAVKVRVASNGSSTLTVFNSGGIVWRLAVMNLGH
jgi:hypothetical protein